MAHSWTLDINLHRARLSQHWYLAFRSEHGAPLSPVAATFLEFLGR